MIQAPYVGIGPWGGNGGGRWSYEFRGELKQIIIDHGPLIRSIKMEDSEGYSQRYGAPAMFTITEVSAGPLSTHLLDFFFFFLINDIF